MATLKMVAILKDEDGNPLPGKTINFYVNGSLVATQTTDSNGQAVATYTVGSGTYSVRAVFPGDDQYEPSEATATITVGAPTAKKTSTLWIALGGVALIAILLLAGKKERK